jgi:hypothetical protein
LITTSSFKLKLPTGKSEAFTSIEQSFLQGRNFIEQVLPRFDVIKLLVFRSSFIEGDGNPANTGLTVRTLSAQEPFEILHPIFYYMYTDRIRFTTSGVNEVESISEIPQIDAENAYRLGDLFGLPKLKKMAYDFLIDTTDEDNILRRIFGDFAFQYEEVGKGYEPLFYKHWKYNRSLGISFYFTKMTHPRGDQKKVIQFTKRYIELTQRLRT